jgi:hypothetical protein
LNNHQPLLRYLPKPYGEPWSPTDQASPHQFDYKFSLGGNKEAIEELEALLREERATPGSNCIALPWLIKNGKFTKFTHQVSNKKGFFIQAGCIVTDGFGSRQCRHLLTTLRSNEQVFETGGDRNKPGDACVFSTVFASFDTQDQFGHIPTALFNNVKEYCPWALFARKLLLPDLHMDSRFLGVGYNFENADKKYLILVWHVRTHSIPPTMQIEERQKKEHDVPHWMALESVGQLDLSKKPIDRLALHWLINNEETEPANEIAGFLPHMAFHKSFKRPAEPQVVVRDEIILDLCRMYQQHIHIFNERIKPSGDKISERDFEAHMAQFLRTQTGDKGFSVECIEQAALGGFPASGGGSGRLDLDVRITDIKNPTGTPTNFRYILELKVADEPDEDRKHIAQCLEYAARSLTNDGNCPDAVVLVLGVRSEQNIYPIQGAITYASEAVPVHVIKVALNPTSPSKVKSQLQVSHGIVPVRFGDFPVEDILLVREKDDPTARLPGGKLEVGESAEQALLRETKEELQIEAHQIEKLRKLFPGKANATEGLPLTDESSGQGVARDYRFHPFLVKLTDQGWSELMPKIGNPPFFPGLVNIKTWASDGFGQTTLYPNALSPLLLPELLEEFAVTLPESYSASRYTTA